MTVRYWRNRLTSFYMISGHLYAGKIYCKQSVNAPMTELWDWSKAVFFFPKGLASSYLLKKYWYLDSSEIMFLSLEVKPINSDANIASSLLTHKIVETNDLWNVWDSEWVCIIYLWRGLAALWLHSGITVIHSFHVVTSYFNLLNRTFCLSGKKKLFSSIMCSIKNTLILGWIKVSGQHKRCA